jgi:hypothetical protein
MNDEEFFDEKVWEHEDLWPRERSGAVFLAHVILKIEKAMNPEPLAAPPESSHDLSEAESDAIEDAEAAYEAERLRRRREAVKQFVAAYKAGKFVCVKVPKNGEKIVDVSISIPNWFSETCDHWFRACEYSIERDDGFSTGHPWVFVTKESVEAYFSAPPVSPDASLHYSPYLRLMMEVIRALKIDPENQPKVMELQQEFRARWPKYGKGEKITTNKLRSLATFVREIESEKRQYKKPHKKN